MSSSKLQHRPQKKSCFRSAVMGILLLAILGAACGWWLWQGLFPETPRFNGMQIRVNQEFHHILPGEAISLHTSDKVKIVNISTNVLFNVGIRLFADGFAAGRLLDEENKLSSLLTGQEVFDHYEFRVITQFRNQDLGFTVWEVQPYAEEWLDKVNKTIKPEKRIAVLEQAWRILPEDGRVWRRLLDEYKAQKKWKQAAVLLNQAAEEDPNKEILSELFEVYTAISSTNQIISVLRRMVALNSDDTHLRLQLAEMLEQKKRYPEAITQYEKSKRQVTAKEKLYVYERLGFLYTQTGKYEIAISGYTKAARLNPKDANLYYNLSYLYEKTGRPRKANEYLEKAIRLNPKDMDSRLLLAQRYLEKGALTEADKYLSQILKKDPSSLKALLVKAKILEKQGKQRALKAVYKKIHSLDPKNDTILYNLGTLCYESGDLKQGLAHMAAYIKKHPKDVAAHEVVYDIYRKQATYKNAFKTARTIVKLNPGKVSLYYFIFDYLNKRNAYEEMIPILEQGVTSNSKNAALREQLLFAYLKTDMYDAGLNQIKALVQMKPDDVSLWLQRGRLYEKKGNDVQAMAAYKKVIELSPDHEAAGEAYLRLRMKSLDESNP